MNSNNEKVPGTGRLTSTLMQKFVGQVYALVKDSQGVAVQDRSKFEDDLRGMAYELEKFVRQSVEGFAQSIPQGGGAAPTYGSRPPPPPMPPAQNDPAAKATAGPPPGKGGGAQRHKFLLRLMAGKFAKLFTGPGITYLPREVVAGFDAYLQRLLGITKYEELNEHAQQLLDKIPSRDDTVIWRTILENEGFKVFAFNILIKILLMFEDFEWAKKNFMSIVNNVTDRDAKFVFEDRHFKMLFITLFGEIFASLVNEEAMARIDEDFGANTTYKIKEIHKSFKALK